MENPIEIIEGKIVVKHLPGKHDQSEHGRKRKAAPLSPEEAKKLGDEIESKIKGGKKRKKAGGVGFTEKALNGITKQLNRLGAYADAVDNKALVARAQRLVLNLDEIQK